MCGRFSITTTPEAMRAIFDYENVPNLEPRFNVAPTQPIITIRMTDAGTRTLAMARWGLIPSWSKDGTAAAKMINARGETLLEKPSFREAFLQRRCLVLADGFYEWRIEDGKKQPFRIGMKGGTVFAFAGLWESWQAKQDGYGYEEGDLVETVTIVTTDANDKLRPIHHRMPVILPPEDYAAWLDPANDVANCQKLLKPYPVDPMAFYRVGVFVNNARNDDARCIEPLKAAKNK
jgi:putative SOS response-associated peptidase YedK